MNVITTLIFPVVLSTVLPQSTDENLHNVSEQVLTLLYSKKNLLKICKVGLLFTDP